LEKLFVGFRRHGLVKSFRGCNGGYALARPADQISISEILSAVDESASRNENGNGKDAPAVHAQVDALMAKSEEILYAMLQHLNLADIVSHRVESHPFLEKTLQELR
jgi:Rrf2 family iron-sulfur cluster assembly transcriptional regulator